MGAFLTIARLVEMSFSLLGSFGRARDGRVGGKLAKERQN